MTFSLLVSSRFANSVLRFNPETGEFLGDFVKPGSGGLENPSGLAIGPDGNLYVASFKTNSVLRYDGGTGAFIDAFVSSGGGLSGPISLIFRPDGRLYVVSGKFGSYPRIMCYSDRTGKFLDDFVVANDSGMDSPVGMVFGPDGHLYVTSLMKGEVSRYNGQSGNFMDAFVPPGSYGIALGDRGSSDSLGFNGFTGITFGPDNNLYVASLKSNSVLRFHWPSGEFMESFFSSGSGNLEDPTGIQFGPDGNLYVNSHRNSSVLKYNGANGDFLGALVPPGGNGLSGPNIGLLFVENFTSSYPVLDYSV